MESSTPGDTRHIVAIDSRYKRPNGPVAGTTLVHKSGAVIVACCHSDGSPPDLRFPCWVVVWGAQFLGNRGWLHPFEVGSLGPWQVARNVLESVGAHSESLKAVAG